MTDAQILDTWASFVGEPSEKYPLTDADKIGFARAVLARSLSEQIVQTLGGSKEEYTRVFNMGRDSAQPAASAEPPLTPDEARWAARNAELMCGPSDATQPAQYAMAGALAYANKLRAPAAEQPNVPTGLIAALRNQRQLDRDGSEVAVSRQAVDQAADLLGSLPCSAQPDTPDRDLVAIKDCLLHEEPDLALALEVIYNSRVRIAAKSAMPEPSYVTWREGPDCATKIVRFEKWPPFEPLKEYEPLYTATQMQDCAAATVGDRADAERYRWASANDENARTLHSIVINHGGDQEKINIRVDFYRGIDDGGDCPD